MLQDNNGRKISLGQKVCVQLDIPSPDGMLYKNEIVKLDSGDNKNIIRVKDSTGKIWFVKNKYLKRIV